MTPTHTATDHLQSAGGAAPVFDLLCGNSPGKAGRGILSLFLGSTATAFMIKSLWTEQNCSDYRDTDSRKIHLGEVFPGARTLHLKLCLNLNT